MEIYVVSKEGNKEKLVWILEDTLVGEWLEGRVFVKPDDYVDGEEYRVRWMI